MQEGHVEIERIEAEEKKSMNFVVEGKKTWCCEAGKEHWLCVVLTIADNRGSDHLDKEAPKRYEFSNW